MNLYIYERELCVQVGFFCEGGGVASKLPAGAVLFQSSYVSHGYTLIIITNTSVLLDQA